LLHEIYGNPFRPLQPRSFPLEAMELARLCASGGEDLFPILADALEELGETDASLHCRQAKHHKSCHVLEWILAEGR